MNSQNDADLENTEKKSRLQCHDKAERILQQLTLSEKVSLLSGKKSLDEVNASIHGDRVTHYNETPYPAGGLAKHGIPELLFVDGTRGIVCGRDLYTCFPVASMRGATFNKSLEEKIGKAMADEVLLAGGNFFGGVCVNVPYHPGWGRAQETYGEDPCLIGELASASIRGIQSRGVIACIKHFAFNSMENMRFEVNITCDKQTEREVFLPQFKKCIDSGAAAVMSAYNSYNGICCGHNAYLLSNILRQEWEFDGITISDFNWGISDTVSAFRAGVDIEMPNTNYYGRKLIDAVNNGKLSEDEINEAALRVIRTLLAYKTRASENLSNLNTYSTSLPDYAASMHKQATAVSSMHSIPNGNSIHTHACFYNHAALALQCAREGITMLKNKNDILPLRGKRANGSIAILGKLAETENTGDYGSSRVYAPYVTTVLDGIQNLAKKSSLIYYSGDSASHCKRLASEADTVIIVVGNTYMEEGERLSAYTPTPDNLIGTHEDSYPLSYSTQDKPLHANKSSASVTRNTALRIGGDRTRSLRLSENDLKIINAVAEIRNDAIVIIYGGSTILMTEWHDRVGAILYAYYPGMEGGTAIAETLFGKNNPGGRLPFVIPRHESDLPEINWNASHQEYGYYHGYTLLDIHGKKPLYPFGFGLSYTTFWVEELTIWIDNFQKTACAAKEKPCSAEEKSCAMEKSPSAAGKMSSNVNKTNSAADKALCASIKLTNTGKRSGSEVVLMYVGKKDSSVRRPIRILKAFEKVTLKKGQSQIVTLKCSLNDIMYYDTAAQEFRLETGTYQVYVTAGSRPEEEVVGEVDIIS